MGITVQPSMSIYNWIAPCLCKPVEATANTRWQPEQANVFVAFNKAVRTLECIYRDYVRLGQLKHSHTWG